MDVSSHFFEPHAVTKFQGKSINRGVKYTEVEFFFSIIAFISETVGDRPIVMGNTIRKSRVADRSVSVPMTLSVLEKWDAKGQIKLSRVLP